MINSFIQTLKIYKNHFFPSFLPTPTFQNVITHKLFAILWCPLHRTFCTWYRFIKHINIDIWKKTLAGFSHRQSHGHIYIVRPKWDFIISFRILVSQINLGHHLRVISVLSYFYKYHFFSLAQTWVHSYAITSRTKQAVYTNLQLWIDKTATFNLTPSGITSALYTLTVSCVYRTGQVGHCLGGRLQEWVENKRSANFHRFGLGDAGGPIDSRVGHLCNHVGFTDVAAPIAYWLAAVWAKKSIDSRQPIFEGKARKNWPTLSQI
jgi:hypothetical protein